MPSQNRDTGWFKSSYSDNSSNQCVECRFVAGERVGVRDSKNPSTDVLRVKSTSWRSFVAGVRTGRFDGCPEQG
ncbi:DUF397 domain-containing protein [Goodfellowiella coeruleoviolacea]|uniref:DUF397 domain-containing protein n=1 Tax=Goodfellowiella coeruleoviolacea TaxID=334858 RepID=A0AAE3GL19_9PSEU|nr:DUF397 domain-containing protein [Goodfellowiella coeruleoviolacea]MCP2168013.1 protein of unknown function (DUF397) [Goodfellowiella coeruleoviolacea]